MVPQTSLNHHYAQMVHDVAGVEIIIRENGPNSIPRACHDSSTQYSEINTLAENMNNVYELL